MTYQVANANREVYAVNAAGEIARPRRGRRCSSKWRARALVRFSNSGQIVQRVPFEDWEQFIQQAVQWCHQNGKPRYYLEDWDHGTVRIQGQGVISVRNGQ